MPLSDNASPSPGWMPPGSLEEAKRIQERLKSRMELGNRFPDVCRVGGMDISYNRFSKKAVGVLTVLSYPELTPLEEVYSVGDMVFPYVPGYLAFREGPVLLSAYEKITRKPDLILFDGQGYAHPRRFGIACHMGVLLDIPAIGCAKSVLVGEFRLPDRKKGSTSDLADGDEKIGTVFRSRDGVRPIFVSPGHRVDFATSVEFVSRCLKGFRVPEPIRLAHTAANVRRRELLSPR